MEGHRTFQCCQKTGRLSCAKKKREGKIKREGRERKRWCETNRKCKREREWREVALMEEGKREIRGMNILGNRGRKIQQYNMIG